MKATEFRIGNYFTSDLKTDRVTTENIEWVTVNAECFEPIPLTEEWLLKFGFVEHPLDWYRLKDFSICLKESGRCTVCCSGGIFHIYAYIHQLQNLYFCLSGGEELTTD